MNAFFSSSDCHSYPVHMKPKLMDYYMYTCILFLQIIEDFLELMYRCMFLAPLSLVQSYLSPQPSLQSESPLGPSQSHAHLKKTESYLETAQYSNCTSVRDNSDNVVESEGSGEGFIQLLPTLTSGKYTWKVSPVCCSTIASSPGHITLKTWEWPGDEASSTMYCMYGR